MKNTFYFQTTVSRDQIEYAKDLVAYSLEHHKVSNIWDRHAEKQVNTKKYRLIGTLGEIIFADTYGLPRPARSYGAWDGQDLGMDFTFPLDNNLVKVDIKSMLRKSGLFYPNYVLNIPASQLNKENSLTDYYFCISLHRNKDAALIASFLGTISKKDLEEGHLGVFYPAGTMRTRADKSTFQFNEATYEVDFGDIVSPPEPPKKAELLDFSLKKLKTFRR